MSDGEPGLYSEMDIEEPAPAEPHHEGAPEDEEMPLAEHIEEMVRRLGVVVLVMAIAAGITFPFGDRLINFLWNSILPGTDVARPRVYHPLALMLARLKVSTLAGFIVALPVFVYETYLFMRPGLYPRERKYYLAAVPTSLVLAAIGVTFAFLLVLPAIFSYFLYYSQGAANIAFGLTQTFDLIVLMLGTFAFIFQIPLFVMLAVMMGVTSRRWLESRRIYFWGGFLTLAFLFSPDPTGMAPILVAVTMVVLFEGTLTMLRWTQRGSLVPTFEETEAARPFLWGLAAFGGYLASPLPVPDGYFDQLPPVVLEQLAARGVVPLTPVLIGGGIILTYELLGRLLQQVGAGSRVRRTYARVRLPLWLTAVVVGYYGSPNPTLIEAARDLALSRPLVAAVVAVPILCYEGGLFVWRLRRRHSTHL
jgi:sec-independent protein translocase protein TatC